MTALLRAFSQQSFVMSFLHWYWPIFSLVMSENLFLTITKSTLSSSLQPVAHLPSLSVFKISPPLSPQKFPTFKYITTAHALALPLSPRTLHPHHLHLLYFISCPPTHFLCTNWCLMPKVVEPSLQPTAYVSGGHPLIHFTSLQPSLKLIFIKLKIVSVSKPSYELICKILW